MMMIKGKRTKRARPASPLALAISASTSSDVESGRVPTSSSTTTATTTEQEDQDMAAHCLILLAQGDTKFQKLTQQPPSKPAPSSVAVCAYECKTCNRSFPSFQALGGHRASHNKPRALQPVPEKPVGPPSFMLVNDHHHHHHDAQHQDYFQSGATNNKLANNGAVQEEMTGLSLQIACGYNSSTSLSASNAKPKVHACSICGAEFSSGQALGGHMRRHRPLPSATSTPPAAPPRNQLCLDLNLPAEEQEDVQQQPTAQPPQFTFASDKTTLVFASSLVDCRH